MKYLLLLPLVLAGCATAKPHLCSEVDDQAHVFVCNFPQAQVLITPGSHTIIPNAPKPSPSAIPSATGEKPLK